MVWSVIMRLAELVRLHASMRDVGADYVYQLNSMVRALERVLGRPVYVHDLQADTLNRALQRWKARGIAPSTRKSRRRMLLTLWHSAADRDLLPPPRRRSLAPVNEPDRLPQCWTRDQVLHLLHTAEQLEGWVSPKHLPGVSRRAYWSSYVAAAWDMSLRGRDMRRRSLDDVIAHPDPHRTDACVQLVQTKSGRYHVVHVQGSTIARIRACLAESPRPLIWPAWGNTVREWRRQARQLVQRAGLPGSIGWLRHSSGTDVENRSPGDGHRYLGNSADVFARHYFSRTTGQYRIATPTPLEPPDDGDGPATIPMPDRPA